MLIREHLERAAAFEAGIAKLDPVEDTELYVVFLMRAATNRMNAALHALDVTEEGPVAPGKRVGDLNHSYKPALYVELPVEVQALLRELASIEDLRPQYVRGPDLLTFELAAACSRSHQAVVAGTSDIIARGKATA